MADSTPEHAGPVKRGRGRPKGSKNKKTLEKERLQALAASRRTPPVEPAVATTPSKPASAGPSQPITDKGRKPGKRPPSDEEPSADINDADEGTEAITDDERTRKPSSRPRKKVKTSSSGASSGAVPNGDSKSPETVDAIPAPTSPPAATPKKRGRPSRKSKIDEAA